MWTYRNPGPLTSAPTAASATHRISWEDAWLAVREAIRPFPEAAKAVGVIVDRLIAEIKTHGDPGRPAKVPHA